MALLMSVKGTLQWQKPDWGLMIAVQKGSWPGYGFTNECKGYTSVAEARLGFNDCSAEGLVAWLWLY